MDPIKLALSGMLALALVPLAPVAHAYDSGSTGADGAFSPTVNTQYTLPDSGILNFTSVDIPAGVTVTFKKNSTNSPVVILASGSVNIAGELSVSGTNAAGVGAAGDGAIGDDGQPGLGGPGGYDGGRGGVPGTWTDVPEFAGDGFGPGAGGAGYICTATNGTKVIKGGAGGGFASDGGTVTAGPTNCTAYLDPTGGSTYGADILLPLIGGSGGGGGGGGGGSALPGGGGGGGGGAILIASSGTVSVTGAIRADGGKGGDVAGAGVGGSGGGGSGGAIRIIATSISGNGVISATYGQGGSQTSVAGQYLWLTGRIGGQGRVRLEYETITRTASSSGVETRSSPTATFVAGLPTLRIVRVANQSVPSQPTGNADITLPAATPNPVTVEFETTGVPVGNTVMLTVTPAYGNSTSAISPALAGTTANATASVSIDLPTGPSVLSAQTTYAIVASIGDQLSRFAQGERVEKIRLSATLGGVSIATLITVSGKEFEVPLAMLATGG